MTGTDNGRGGLPRRTAQRPPAGPRPSYPPSLAGDPSLPYRAIEGELTDLRIQIPGVRGCLLGGVDGLLISHNLLTTVDADDLAALAASSYGLGRQVAFRLDQGPFLQSTVRNGAGYLSVYAVGDRALLAVVGTDTVNVARLHLHAPPVADRLAALLSGSG
ncbi:roadblock/LC7 domain-containing protein [Plantactinospora siamensis]|uniref:Roadblock/LC7 domain-containing protein n=1 Tax=Plantactinospora siamensis TaxID=555372 RepID=A0ABV6NY56_9ACTN